MVPFESFGTVSYSHSIVTMAVSCIISEIKPDIGRKSRFFHTPCISHTPFRGSPLEYCILFCTENLEWWLPDGKKVSSYVIAVWTEDRRVKGWKVERAKQITAFPTTTANFLTALHSNYGSILLSF